MYMYVYEHVWVSIFWLYCILCSYRKRRKVHTKKEIFQENQNFIELLPSARPPTEIEILSLPSARPPTEIEILSLPSARPPTEIEILSVLVIISWTTEIKLCP